MNLHTFNKPSAFERFASYAGTDDVLLLIEDGVYLCLDVDFCQTGVCVLEADMAARGLSSRFPDIECIDYRRFVQLCTEADTVYNWF